MLFGTLFGIGLLPFGGFVVLAFIINGICIISCYWHKIPD
jgi:hypothetical protein